MGLKHLLLSLSLLYGLCYAMVGETDMARSYYLMDAYPPTDSDSTVLSHKIHSGKLKIACDFCHRKKLNGTLLILPSTCNTCHILPQDSFSSNSTSVVLRHISGRIRQGEEVNEYLKSELFPHKTHETLGCETCHQEAAPTSATHISLSKCEKCHYGTGKAFPYWRRPKHVDTLCKIVLESKKRR